MTYAKPLSYRKLLDIVNIADMISHSIGHEVGFGITISCCEIEPLLRVSYGPVEALTGIRITSPSPFISINCPVGIHKKHESFPEILYIVGNIARF